MFNLQPGKSVSIAVVVSHFAKSRSENLQVSIVIIVLLLSLSPGLLNADTTTIDDGCVKYLATGKVYEVTVQIVDGEDLWPKYSWANVLTKYAIVFWDNDEATVIDLGVFGLLMETGTTGTDRQGRKWKVAKRPWC